MTKLPDWEETFNALSEEDKAAMGEQRAIWENLIEQRHAALVHIEELAAARKFNEALGFIESHERADKIVTWDEQYKFTDDEAREIIRENRRDTQPAPRRDTPGGAPDALHAVVVRDELRRQRR